MSQLLENCPNNIVIIIIIIKGQTSKHYNTERSGYSYSYTAFIFLFFIHLIIYLDFWVFLLYLTLAVKRHRKSRGETTTMTIMCRYLGQQLGKHHDEMFSEFSGVINLCLLFSGTQYLQH